MKCSICKRKDANVWRHGERICKICWLSYKHSHFVPFKRALNRIDNRKGHEDDGTLMKEFLELHQEVIVADAVGNLSVSNARINEYLKKFV